MIRTTLEATNAREEIVRALLEDCISEELADKINNGVWIEKDRQRLCNKKDLSGFMAYACEEAKKQAEKGANCACIDEDTLLGWAIHYFEEESIGKLYTESGDEYKPQKKAPPKVEAKVATVAKATAVATDNQTSLFDLYEDIVPESLSIDTETGEVLDSEPAAIQTLKAIFGDILEVRL